MIISPVSAADTATVASHYDDLDLFYRTIWGTHVHHGYWRTGKESTEQALVDLIHLIAERAGVKPGVSVCDLGCGYGDGAKVFAEHYDARVVGITVSRKQYDYALATSAGLAKVHFLLGDGSATGLPAESFDCVVAIESSEHMADKPAFFTEARRLLRPGGRLAIAAWLSREHPKAMESKYLLEPICAEGRLPSMASASEYLAMLREAGLNDVKFEELTRNVKKTWSVCALRCVTRISTHPFLRQRLTNPEFGNRVFAKTVFRIWLAYRTGSMRYGVFTAVKRRG